VPSDKDDIARWLALAAEARGIAAEMTDHTARATMRKIAEGYENLIIIAEKRQKFST
jgi:hypothetical protein